VHCRIRCKRPTPSLSRKPKPNPKPRFSPNPSVSAHERKFRNRSNTSCAVPLQQSHLWCSLHTPTALNHTNVLTRKAQGHCAVPRQKLPHGHPEVIRRVHTKFGPDSSKTVAAHNTGTEKWTDKKIHFYICYINKL